MSQSKVNLGELKEAELLIRKSIELNPKDPGAYTNLGRILIKLKKNIKRLCK